MKHYLRLTGAVERTREGMEIERFLNLNFHGLALCKLGS